MLCCCYTECHAERYAECYAAATPNAMLSAMLNAYLRACMNATLNAYLCFKKLYIDFWVGVSFICWIDSILQGEHMLFFIIILYNKVCLPQGLGLGELRLLHWLSSSSVSMNLR